MYNNQSWFMKAIGLQPRIKIFMDGYWYLSPSDRFLYESQFLKFSLQSITLQNLDEVFNESRLSELDFLQAWFGRA